MLPLQLTRYTKVKRVTIATQVPIPAIFCVHTGGPENHQTIRLLAFLHPTFSLISCPPVLAEKGGGVPKIRIILALFRVQFHISRCIDIDSTLQAEFGRWLLAVPLPGSKKFRIVCHLFYRWLNSTLAVETSENGPLKILMD